MYMYMYMYMYNVHVHVLVVSVVLDTAISTAIKEYCHTIIGLPSKVGPPRSSAAEWIVPPDCARRNTWSP